MIRTAPLPQVAGKRQRLSFTQIRDYQDDKMAFLLRAAEQHGGVVRYKMAWIDMTVITDPDIVRELIVKRPQQLHRDSFTTKVLGRIMGQGVFVAEGDEWQRQRKLVQPAFHAMRIRNYADTMAMFTEEMCRSWIGGSTVVLDQEMAALTLRIIAQTMFNIDLQEQTERIGRLMSIILEAGETQLDMAFVPPPWVPTALNRRLNPALAELRSIMREIVHQRLQTKRDEGDLLSMLVLARDDEGQPMGVEDIVDECMTLLIAGHETTAVALSWTWILLSQHPAMMEKLYAEVDAVLDGDPISYEKLAELAYTEMVIKESLRLYPPAFGFARTPLNDITVDGQTFRRGELLMISSYAMHRLADYFPEPEAFRPERWSEDAPQPPKYAYIPFGAGPRICLGNMFAMMEAQIILATMAQHVRLSPAHGAQIEARPLITLRPEGPVQMSVAKRG